MKAILNFFISEEFIFTFIFSFCFALLGLMIFAVLPTTLICGVCFWAVVVLYLVVFVYAVATMYGYEIEIK